MGKKIKNEKDQTIKPEEVKFLPGIQYSGAPEFAALWDEFTRNYTKGTAPGIETTNMLNTLAFGGGVNEIIEQHAADDRSYAIAKHEIEKIAQAASLISENERTRPLNRELARRLLPQWIEQEKAHKLYPPRSLSGSSGITNAEREAEYAKREKLLNSPKGGIIAGALRMLEDNTVEALTTRVHGKLKSRISRPDVLEHADAVFYNALFNFEHGHEAQFNTYVQTGLDNFLEQRVRRALSLKKHVISDMVAGDALLNDNTVDTKTKSAFENMAMEEEHNNVTKALEKLDPRQREILTSRFGINGEPESLKDIGERLGLTKERVRQIEVQARDAFRKAYSKISGELPPPADEKKPTPRLIARKKSTANKHPEISEDRTDPYVSIVQTQMGNAQKIDKEFEQLSPAPTRTRE